ncbi:pentatricopeptide repeat-containing protein At1g05750, chloroplastic-like [Papaver somniferum]|uniref:pentatricopeptide repeat-containing protein At1g05750, chloroplastic-like n=1 Tax=Papaver somniferum TaxID=3469 RepID=UPI000E701378|nr:pentatricopeptide repeat-containing protein At1g05750, chloroplastic-like [Papaver somniferum]
MADNSSKTLQPLEKLDLKSQQVCMFDARMGKCTHAWLVRRVFCNAKPLLTQMIEYYSVLGQVDLSEKEFKMIRKPWVDQHNILLHSYALGGESVKGMELFSSMKNKGIYPNLSTFTGVLSCCSHGGQDLMNEALRFLEPRPTSVMLNTVLAHCTPGGNLNLAQNVFGRMLKYGFKEDGNLRHSFNAVKGLVKEVKLIGVSDRAKTYLRKAPYGDLVMMYEFDVAAPKNMKQITTNKHGVVKLLNCFDRDCEVVGADSKDDVVYGMMQLDLKSQQVCMFDARMGKCTHAWLVRRCFCNAKPLLTQMIEYYSVLGQVDLSEKEFKMIRKPCVDQHNILLHSYALGGESVKGMELFSSMKNKGIYPNLSTFTGVLSCCSHGGQDLMNEALRFLEPRPTSVMLNTVLAHCTPGGNLNLAQNVFGRMLKYGFKEDGTLATMSNTYSAFGAYKDAAKFRKAFMGEGKTAGTSTIRNASN